MASTRNLQASIAWCAPFLRYLPQTQASLEPALSSANLIKQTILGAPFTWRQNRAYFQIQATTAAGQDYTQALGDFGFLESATSTDSTGKIMQFPEQPVLSLSSEQGRPAGIAVQSDDNAGNITFRLSTVPDQTYTITGTYQRKATPMTSLASLWAPLPDELAYIYDNGLLAMSMMLSNDGRFPTLNQKFIGHLLAAQDSISEIARNIFLGNWLQVTAQAQRGSLAVQQGMNARTM